MSEAEEYSYIGKRVPRVDAIRKVTGKAEYFGDVKLPGMLTVKILTSPYPHARIISIDTSKAEKLSGVRAVVTSEDMPKIALDFYMPGIEGVVLENFPLAIDKVRFIGKEVAAVAADNESIAEEALKLIDVKYEVLEAIFDPEQSMKPNAPRLYDGVENNIARTLSKTHGEVDKGFEEADYIFEDEFKTQPQYHSAMERKGCVCSWDVEGNLTMWTPTQTPHLIRWEVSTVLEIPMAKVRVINPNCGGGFGAHAHIVHPYMIICAILAKKAGKPVKVEFGRGEDFAYAATAPPFIVKLKSGVRKDGKLTAREVKMIVDCGAHTLSALGQMKLGYYTACVHLYKAPNIKFDGYVVYTNNPIRTLPYRGFGNPQVAWAIESQMDIIADKLGMDPMELRLRNLFEPGEISVTGCKFDAYGLPECIKKAAEAANWSEKKREGMPNRGIGMACLVHISGQVVYGSIETSSVLLIAKEDGSFDLYTDCSEIGTGIWTVCQQIAAETLGTRLEDIKVTGGDTAVGVFELGSYASRATYSVGNAVKIAATDMMQQLFEVAATMLAAKVEDLEAKDGEIYVKNAPEKKVPISEVTYYAHFKLGKVLISKGIWNMPIGPYDPSADRWPPPGMCTSYPFGCQVAEVEVDPKTGKVELLSLTAAHDVGFPINLNSVEGQIEGGLVMGCGYALTENLTTEEGRVLVTDFADYFVWRAPDIPQIKPIVVTTDDSYGPFGAKGLGEPVLVPTAPAIANAIYDAIGVRIKELPVTSEKILKALKERR